MNLESDAFFQRKTKIQGKFCYPTPFAQSYILAVYVIILSV